MIKRSTNLQLWMLSAVAGNKPITAWSSSEAAKTAPWPSRGLHHFSKFLSPQMSELVEDAVAS